MNQLVFTYDTGEEMILNMGPHHPSTHGVLRFIIRTDGEIMREAIPVVGYLHRAIEKIAEGILRLAEMADGEATFRRRRHCHRYVLQLLEESARAQACCRILTTRFAVGRRALTRRKWDNRWRGVTREIAEAIAPTAMPVRRRTPTGVLPPRRDSR